jgi:hypothetical protein
MPWEATQIMEYQPHTIQLIEDLLEALSELRTSTRETEATVRRGLKLVVSGADVATALRAVNPADTRQSINDALKTVEEARHRMRLHIFEIGLQEGLSIGELGRIFGFSRQLAARYAKEAREAD